MTKNKRWSNEQKFAIGLAALKGDMTIHELCQHYQVAPSQVHAWKKVLLDLGAGLFDKGVGSKQAKALAKQAETERALYEKIGQLTVERDFLKKAYGKLPQVFCKDS